jgi:hypothetical protein
VTGKRKLKCSGEPAGCGRCLKQQLTCHYSAQKQMGRPRKRQKTIDDPSNDEIPAISPQNPIPGSTQPGHKPPKPASKPSFDPELTEKDIERTNFQNICNAAIAQTVKRSASEARAAAERTTSANSTRGSTQQGSQGSNNTSPYDGPHTPPEGSDALVGGLYPTDLSQWPDFSDLAMLPIVVQDRNEREKQFYPDEMGGNTPSGFAAPIGAAPYSNYLSRLDADPNTLGQFPTVPACPCLPNLYLTLSTLSALSAFPISSGMIDTLLNAHRTCRSVIYCTVCPQKMQSGSQNVFLSTMLVTVLADHWHRVKKAAAKELKLGFGSTDSDSIATLEPMSVREDLEWRTFGYHLIRAFVFGDQPIPDPPGSRAPPSRRKPQSIPTHVASEDSDTSTIYTLDSLVNALERRQKQWHDVEPYCHSQEFPPKLTAHHPLHTDHHARAHGFPRGYAPGMTLEDIKKCEDEHRASGGGDDGVLCLKIVKHSRIMMKSLEGGVPRVEG